MGKRGTKPTPNNVLQMRGSWRADATSAGAHVNPGAPDPPAWLNPGARAIWAAEVERLVVAVALADIDAVVFADYCMALEEARLMEAVLDDEGRWTTSEKSGYKQVHPAVAIRNKAWERANKAGARLGLSPSDRARLSVPAQNESKDDKKSRHFAD